MATGQLSLQRGREDTNGSFTSDPVERHEQTRYDGAPCDYYPRVSAPASRSTASLSAKNIPVPPRPVGITCSTLGRTELMQLVASCFACQISTMSQSHRLAKASSDLLASYSELA